MGWIAPRDRSTRGATIGMQRKLTGWMHCFLAAFDQSFGGFAAFPQGHHPAGDVAAENIHDHVEIEMFSNALA
jgi:hypothetical protein